MSEPKFTALGVDVGGTKIAAGVVAFPEGVVRARREIRLVSELAAEACAAGHPVQGIGVGVCEIVDRSGNIASANCLDWSSDSMRQRLSKIAPTVIEADVRAAARAEALFGAGRHARVFLYVTIGTGIASCLVIDSQPFTGARGATWWRDHLGGFHAGISRAGPRHSEALACRACPGAASSDQYLRGDRGDGCGPLH